MTSTRQPECLLLRSYHTYILLLILASIQLVATTNLSPSSVNEIPDIVIDTSSQHTIPISRQTTIHTTTPTTSAISSPSVTFPSSSSSYVYHNNNLASLLLARHLQSSANADWNAFNDVLYHAIIRFPDNSMSSSGLTMKVTDLQCTQVSVNAITVVVSEANDQQVVMKTTISGLDMTCTARYQFDGYLIVNGSGDLLVESFNNVASTETVFSSIDYARYPPHDSYVKDCSPQININNMDFSNGGFWGWTMDTLEGAFRGSFERMAEEWLCQEVEWLSNQNMDQLLEDAQNQLVQYPASLVIDPLQTEDALNAWTPSSLRLLNWQQPESYPFGFWMDQAWADMIAYLVEEVELPDGTTNLNANVLLREHLLEEGILSMELDNNVLYQGHDAWLKSRITAQHLRIVGLDSLTRVEPIETIGAYTLNTTLVWDTLLLELDVVMELEPSSQPGSYISDSGTNQVSVKEPVTIQFALRQVTAGFAILLALDQTLVEALQVRDFLDKNQFLACFLSAIHQVQVAALTLEAMDLEPPRITGLISPGLDNLLSNVLQGAFLMYESSLLASSKAFFQTTVRSMVNDHLQQQYQAYGKQGCQPWTLEAPIGVVDIRDLFLGVNQSITLGGAGNQRYGTLFSEFVMPTLQQQLLQDNHINTRVIQPFTADQSGQEGTLVSSETQLVSYIQHDPNETSWVSMMGWNLFSAQMWEAKVQTLDTVVSPVQAFEATDDSHILTNLIRMGETQNSINNNITSAANNGKGPRPLRFYGRMMASGIGKTADIKDMHNFVELSLEIPASTISLDLKVAMNETSLLEFPLQDLNNQFCWLASLSSDLELETAAITMPQGYSLDINCVACSSAGVEAIPDVMTVMEKAGLTQFLLPHMERLLMEVGQGVWKNMNFAGMRKDAPNHCPHHPQFDPEATARSTYGFSNVLSRPPAWSRESVETISSVGFLVGYAGLFLLGKNEHINVDAQHGSEIAIEAESSFNHSWGVDLQQSDNLQLLDWTNLSATLGPYADNILNEVRQTLQESVVIWNTDAGDTPNMKRMLSNIFSSSISTTDTEPAARSKRYLEANSFVREHLLDDEGFLTFGVNDMEVELAGISFALRRVRLQGIDSIIQLDPFIVLGPHTLQNFVELNALDVVLDVEVNSTENSEIFNLTANFSFLDITIDLPLVLAMDLDKLGKIELGSLLKMNQILPCLLPDAHEVSIPRLGVSVGKIEAPIIEGLLSANLQEALSSVNKALVDEFGEDLAAALPNIFDTTIRRKLNTKLKQYMEQRDASLCSAKTGGGVIDFRDLFLPPEQAKNLGGTGKAQYGDLLKTIHEVVNQDLSARRLQSNDASTGPSITGVLASWTEQISGESGKLRFDGKLVDTQANISLAGLNALFDFQIRDLMLENIDSLGSPIALLDPIQADVLNNTLSFGVGDNPVKLVMKMLVGMSDQGEMQVRNDVEISVDLYAATVVLTMLTRMAEDAFLAFPLKDVSNYYCWLSKILPPGDDVSGFALKEYAFKTQRMDLNVTCLSCSGPEFADLVLDLYTPTDAEEAADTVVHTFNQVLDGEALQDILDHFVTESKTRCPHSDSYDPLVTESLSSQLGNPGSPFAFTDFTARDSKASYFNYASAVFAGFLLLVFVFGKFIVWKRNKKWKEGLSQEGMYFLRQQKAKEKEQDTIINMYATSLFKSPHISQRVRWFVPIAILTNIALYMGGHLGILATVDLECNLAGEEFMIRRFLEFSFIQSTANTYQNGGMEMTIMVWIFTGVLPYLKLFASLLLWFIPPRRCSVRLRGKLLLWVDTLTKLSIVDIVAMVLVLAVILVYIGGPDETLDADGALYSMRIIIVPGASVYCLVIAQRMSRVSSRFFLDYHDHDVAAARESYQRGDIEEIYKSGVDSKSEDTSHMPKFEPKDGEGAAWVGQVARPYSKSDLCSARSVGGEETQVCQISMACKADSDIQGIVAPPDDLGVLHGGQQDEADEECSSKHQVALYERASSDRECPSSDEADQMSVQGNETRCRSFCLRLSHVNGTFGVIFCGFTVLALLIIGCIFAPAVAIDVSDLWSLALENDTTLQSVATEYGVFSIVSTVLLKSQFILENTWDYVALGFLIFAGSLSMGMVSLISFSQFLKRFAKEGKSALSLRGSTSAIMLPSYLRLHAYLHIEIFVVAVVAGCWQLGSVSIYIIHLYCSILDAVYKVLTYIGLAAVSDSDVQCFPSQMSQPDNLLIFFGALAILLLMFIVQCSKQYRKNVKEACDLLQHQQDKKDIEHLSSLWNSPNSTRKNLPSASSGSPWTGPPAVAQLNETASFSDSSGEGSVAAVESPSRGSSCNPSRETAEHWFEAKSETTPDDQADNGLPFADSTESKSATVKDDSDAPIATSFSNWSDRGCSFFTAHSASTSLDIHHLKSRDDFSVSTISGYPSCKDPLPVQPVEPSKSW